MQKLLTLGAVVAAMALSGTALADEVWSTEIGDVVYETDLENGQAVLSYPVGEDSEWRGRAFFPGLAGEYEGRTSYDGFWMEPGSDDGESGCMTEMRDPETGNTSDVWGRVKLVFVDQDFPGTWVALRGQCFAEPDSMLVGTPVVAGGVE